MSEVNLEAACQLFDTEMTLQYQNRLKLQNTIEERHGLQGTAVNVPFSDLEMNQTNFAPTDIFVTPVNQTSVQVLTHDYHLKRSLVMVKKPYITLTKFVITRNCFNYRQSKI